jgi:hypothetical protein
MDNSRLLYHFEIRDSELAKIGDPMEIEYVELALQEYNGQLRTRTDIYKEQLDK